MESRKGGRFLLMKKKLFVLLAAFILLFGQAHAQAQGVNILLIGVDTLEENINGRSDTMILVHVNPETAEIRMVSFLRDLYVSIPGVGKTRLNAAYMHGGEELLKQTLSNTFGISVDYTVTVHFSMLADLVDQLGGIEIEVTSAERSQINKLLEDYNDATGQYGGELEAGGLQRLTGKQALCYSRIRKIDSDFQRTSRQQTVITAMMKRAGELGYWQLLKLALANLPKVQTDLRFTDIVTLAPLVTQLDRLNLQTARVPFDGAYHDETINGMMVLVPNLERCRTQLQDFLN